MPGGQAVHLRFPFSDTPPDEVRHDRSGCLGDIDDGVVEVLLRP
ncbi:hypothetical protein [Lentzea sp.]